MSTDYKNQVLIQTFVELDSHISHLTRKISADRFIEIGDDPVLIREIEYILIRIQHRAKSIEPHFDLATISLSKANIYFALIKRVGDTLKYIQEIRKKDYGSQQHTSELLEKLKGCADSLYAIGDLVTANIETIH